MNFGVEFSWFPFGVATQAHDLRLRGTARHDEDWDSMH